jgi:hypothetical protein
MLPGAGTAYAQASVPPPLTRRLYDPAVPRYRPTGLSPEGDLCAQGEGSYVLASGQRGRGLLALSESRLRIEPAEGTPELRLRTAALQRAVIGRDTFEVLSGGADLGSGRPLGPSLVRVLYHRGGYQLSQLLQDKFSLALGPDLSRLLLRLPDGRFGVLPLQPERLRRYLQPLFGTCPAVLAQLSRADFDLGEMPLLLHDYLEWQRTSAAP